MTCLSPRQTPRRATGRFATRSELVGHVWAIRRQQLYPNLRKIAEACNATLDVVRTILNSEEGLDDYLERGLALGAPRAERRRDPH
jgi:hypothetical protein